MKRIPEKGVRLYGISILYTTHKISFLIILIATLQYYCIINTILKLTSVLNIRHKELLCIKKSSNVWQLGHTQGVSKSSGRFQLQLLRLGNSKDHGKRESHLKDSVPLLTLSLPASLQLAYHQERI
jgi:hypothetical protein